MLFMDDIVRCIGLIKQHSKGTLRNMDVLRLVKHHARENHGNPLLRYPPALVDISLEIGYVSRSFGCESHSQGILKKAISR